MESIHLLIERMPILLEGSALVLGLGLLALLLSLVLGMLIALCRLSPLRPLSYFGLAYTTIIRGIPELVLLLLIFYSVPEIINNWRFARADALGIDIDPIIFVPFWSGVAVIGLIYAAYMAETLRGAMMAVPSGQLEAAHAYGLSKSRIFFRITFPQMVRHALPGVSNNWLVMLKATALVSLIMLQDIVKVSKDAAIATGHQFTFFLFAGFVFLLFTSVSVLIFRFLEYRYSIGFVRR